MAGSRSQMNDPIMDMKTQAVAIHELYTSLRAAGFGRCTALYLIASLMAGGPRCGCGGSE